MGDATLAIHAGEEKFRVGAPVGTAISRTANFTFESTEEMKTLGRGKKLGLHLHALRQPDARDRRSENRGARRRGSAVVTASGSAAISAALLSQLRAGDELIATRQLYGGSYRLLRDVFPRYGIVVRHVEADLEGIERLVNPAHESALHRDADESDVAARRSRGRRSPSRKSGG